MSLRDAKLPRLIDKLEEEVRTKEEKKDRKRILPIIKKSPKN